MFILGYELAAGPDRFCTSHVYTGRESKLEMSTTTYAGLEKREDSLAKRRLGDTPADVATR